YCRRPPFPTRRSSDLDRVARHLEDAPTLRVALGLAGVLAGDEALGAIGEEAELRVDVETAGVVGDRLDHSLRLERRAGLVGIERSEEHTSELQSRSDL